MTRPRKIPKPLSEDRLRAAAVRYLARFAASRAQVLQVLTRKIKRDLARRHEPAADASWQAVAHKIVADLARQGFLDDRRFAEGRARSLVEAGRPLARVRNDLRVRGVAPELIEDVLVELKDGMDGPAQDSDALDRAAAIRFARRRRLGPFAIARTMDPEAKRAAQRKALAAFARAGFSYAVAQEVLAADDSAAFPDDDEA